MKKILIIILLCFALPDQSFSAEIRTLSVEFIFNNSTTQPKQVRGYRLYKEGTQVCVRNDPSATEMTCPIRTEDGVFDFTLRAVYSDNSESPPSPIFQMSIEAAGDAANPPSDDLDNGETGTSRTGSWSTSAGPNPYGTNSLYSKTAGAKYSYDLGITGVSEISLWWTIASGRCTGVPVQIYDGTILIDTAYVNQRNNGGVWNTIGEYDFTNNGRVVIKSESSSCSTSADAVGFTIDTSAPDENTPPSDVASNVFDNGDTGTSRTGTWSASAGPNPYGTNSLYSKTAGAKYSYDLGVTGLSEISLWWTIASGRCTGVPVEIYDGTLLIDTAYINQRNNGGVWNTIGEYDFSNSGRVVIRSDSSSCSTSADAVSFTTDNTPPPDSGSNVFDNGDAETSRTGTWSASSGPNPYGTNSLYSKTAGAKYSYDLGVTGLSEISLWWTTASARCTGTPVEIYDGSLLIDTAYINQRNNGGVWNTIGEYDFSTGARVVIRSDSSSCSTNADAVKTTMVN